MDNKIKSTTKQSQIELLYVLSQTQPSLATELKNVLNKIDDTVYQEADSRLKFHQYPDHAIRYTQSSKLNACPQLSTLQYNHPVAYNILYTLIPRMCQEGLVSLQLYKSKNKQTRGNSIQELTRLRQSTVKEEIDVLIETGFLALYKKASRHDPAIYAINPLVVHIGYKGIDEIEFWNLASPNAYKTFHEMGNDCKEYLSSSSEKDTSGRIHSIPRYITDQPTVQPFHEIKKSISKGTLDTDSSEIKMYDE